MGRDVIEIIARFGETILDVAHVACGRTYRIGTAPDVDLAVPGHTSYPLVDRGRVRCPIGVPLSEDGDTTTLQLGNVRLDITRMQLASTPLPHRSLEWRVAVFCLASLCAHLALWFVAIMRAPVERLVDVETIARPRVRHVHVAHEPETKPTPSLIPKPQVEPVPPVQQASAKVREPPAKRQVSLEPEEAPGQREGGSSPAAAAPRSFGRAARELADAVAKVDVERRVGELEPEDTFNEDDMNDRGFGGGGGGGGRRFRPPPGEIIKSGGYATMAYDVTLCPTKSCTVRGPIPAVFIRANLHSAMHAIYGCWVQHASGSGTILLEFTIQLDGSVRGAKGSGLGETGACAARVASELNYKALGKDALPGQPTETHVRYPLRFDDRDNRLP